MITRIYRIQQKSRILQVYLVHGQSRKEVIEHETPALLFIIEELLVVVVAVAVYSQVAIVINASKVVV